MQIGEIKMKFSQKYNIQILFKIVFIIIFIPFIIVVLFVAVPIIMSIVCTILLLMYFTGKKLNRNMFFFNMWKNPFTKNTQTNKSKSKNTEYYDAEYISIDNDKEK